MKVDSGKFSAPYVDFNYLVFTPEKKPEGKLPMMIFLHGAGERGDDTELLYVHGLPKYIRAGAEYPAIVLAPQSPADRFWPNYAFQLKELIDKVAAEYDADPDRISITGISMGGYGTWEMGASYPDFFSAIAPCCGGGQPWRYMCIKNLPIWTAHGDCDSTVPVSESTKMFEAAKKAGLNPRLTILAGCGHDSWSEFYENTNVVEWMLGQKRGEAPRRIMSIPFAE